MSVAAIIVAAGEGRRLPGALPKPYLPIAGRPMILRTLDRCLAAKTIHHVIVVVAEAEFARCEQLLRSDPALGSGSWSLQTGGATRQQSVARGLEKTGADNELVL